MKKLILLFVLIFLVGTISAWDFDNIKDYDEETKTIEIRNSVLGLEWFQLDTVATIKLNTPLIYNVPRGNDRLVAEFIINNLGEYDNPFNKLEFYNVKDNMNQFGRSYTYKYKTISRYETITDYKETCEEVYNDKNKTYENICIQVPTGTHQEPVYIWVEFVDKLPKEEITIGIFTDVYANDYVEWIPTFYGVEIEEWAAWTEGLNVGLIGAWSFKDV